MYWDNPAVLLCLWLLPVIAGVLVYAHRRRAAAATRFADPAMVQRLMPALRGPRPWIKGGLILLGLTLLVIAGARPRFGVYFEKVAQRGADVFVLLDVSRSMSAQDVAPNRLDRAKSDIRDLLARVAGDRVGLIVFAGKPLVKVPLTADHGFFLSTLDEIDTRSAPRGGTLIGDAIRKCLEAMPAERDRDQAMILITDGEDHDSYPKDAAKAAAERSVKIFTVGLGDAREGARIPLRGETGQLSYLKDRQNQEHWSRLDEGLLKEIALITQGAYIPAGTRAYDLGQVYSDHLANLTRGEYQAEKRKRYAEQFQLFVCLGVALLLLEMAIPGYRSASNPPVDKKATRSAYASVCLCAIVPLCLDLSFPATASAGTREATAKVDEGIAAYRAGQYEQAAAAFAEADIALPDDPRITFDRATALAAQGDEDKAVELFQMAGLGSVPGLAARARYNLGCLAATKARTLFGEHPEEASPDARRQGLELLARAVNHYRDCLQVEPEHEDARLNLERIRLWIKHMEDLWRDRDRQQQRKEMDLLAFLQMLQERQQGLRAAAQALSRESDSPKRRQALVQTESAQRELAEEIPTLKEKVEAGAAQSASPPGAASPTTAKPDLSPEARKAVETLLGVADASATAMAAAADRLHGSKPGEAVASQTEAFTHLDDIYRAVAPFPNLVQRALQTQDGLVQQSTAVVERPEENKEVDLGESAWNQGFVGRWSEVLPPKAQQGLKDLEAGAAAAPAVQPPQQTPADPEEEKKQREGLQRSMQLAITLAPKVHELSIGAAEALRGGKPKDALPKQQEALKLLKEIAEPLPKKPPQEQQQQPKEDQQQQDQQQQQPQRGDQGKDEQQKQDQQQQSQPKPDQMPQQQAEAVLRQAQQRQQQRQQLEKQLQDRLYRPGPVEKDW